MLFRELLLPLVCGGGCLSNDPYTTLRPLRQISTKPGTLSGPSPVVQAADLTQWVGQPGLAPGVQRAPFPHQPHASRMPSMQSPCSKFCGLWQGPRECTNSWRPRLEPLCDLAAGNEGIPPSLRGISPQRSSLAVKQTIERRLECHGECGSPWHSLCFPSETELARCPRFF